MSRVVNVNRRDFLKVSATAAGGLILGVHVPLKEASGIEGVTELKPNVFVQVDSSGEITLWMPRPEMGQGSRTGLTMIVADELEAAWGTIKIIQALAGPSEVWGSMTAGGSSSIRRFWGPLGDAAATVREMLVTAAAARWGVSPEVCIARDNAVYLGATEQKLGYGELVEDAAELPVPEEPSRKDPSEYNYIGKPIPRLDIPSKVDGSAEFGFDQRLPGMKFANVRRCPVFGGQLRGFDDSETLKVNGVERVVEISAGVAVVADSSWAAMKGMEALKIDWDEGPNAGLNSDQIHREMEQAAREEALVAEESGNAREILDSSRRKISAVYEIPYISHSPMEPMNATAHVQGDEADVWAPTQAPQSAQATAARALGIPTENVRLHTVMCGGGFGRRLDNEFVADAVEVSRAIGGPVQIFWTRAEDTQHDNYRPISRHHMVAAFDETGNFTAWRHKVVAHSFNPQRSATRVDRGAMAGAANLSYNWPSALVEWKAYGTAVPVGAWRSVFAAQGYFATEAFLDEVAAEAGRDPLELRLELLNENPRMQAVLKAAADGIGWGRETPEGTGIGIACGYCFGGWCAHAVEVILDGRGRVKVRRVESGLDCGWAVNPDSVASQVEGAVVLALSYVLHGEITIERGRVVQETFAEYPLVTMAEAPLVNTHIVEGGPPLGGVGEPPVPPLAPAVMNAIYAATGKRLRRLPIRSADLRDD